MQANKQQYPSHAKLLGLLRAVQEELPDAPLYYTLSGLCRSVKASSPKMDVLRHAIVNAGYRASNTHCNSEGVKTDAPPEVRAHSRALRPFTYTHERLRVQSEIGLGSLMHCPQVVWDIMRCWVAKNPVRITDKESYQAKILAVEPTIEVSFANAKGVMSRAKADRKARFVQNPENWGPRPKHGRPLLPHEREGQGANATDDGDAQQGAKRQKL